MGSLTWVYVAHSTVVLVLTFPEGVGYKVYLTQGRTDRGMSFQTMMRMCYTMYYYYFYGAEVCPGV